MLPLTSIPPVMKSVAGKRLMGFPGSDQARG
jgi:hypothetical protein